MKKGVSLLLFVTGVGLGTSTVAQQPFSNCTAAFVGNKMVIDTYTTKTHCQLPSRAAGMLTVQTVTLSPRKAKPVEPIAFQVAIRDKATGTLHMYSGDTYKHVPVQNVLTTCKKGDHIVLLTVDKQYALPHNEILVQ